MVTLDRHFVVTDAYIGRAARAAFVAWHHIPSEALSRMSRAASGA